MVYVIEEEAAVEISSKENMLTAGMTVIIPKGIPHRIYNRGTEDTFFLNAYTPPAY